MSSLDHLTDGRVGWNIVTGYLNSAARGVSGVDQTGHDTRYEIGDEYVAVMYKLWGRQQGRWRGRPRPQGRHLHASREGAITANTSTWTPSICASRHRSVRWCCIRRPPRVAPSPRRMRNASSLPHPPSACSPLVADLRKGAREAGRSASDLLIFTLLTVIVSRTDAEAQAKHAEYRRYVSHEGALALVAGWTGIDFAEYDLDEPIKYIKNDAIQSATEALT
jgi:alkanesulfonate monooxygenase SsuD/methylene tetrahydromethanopterin reductase-like flavin-dependent oxidoreductase (luciferase family)